MEAALPIGLMAASQMMGASAEARQLRDGARADEENARRTILEGELANADARRRGRAVQGEAVAALAGSGVAFGGGTSADDLLFQNQLEIEFEVLTRRYGAVSEAASLQDQARQKRGAAKGALFGGMLRAGAAALTGANEIGNANALAKANARLLEVRFPGGQRLPMPVGVYRDGLRPSAPRGW